VGVEADPDLGWIDANLKERGYGEVIEGENKNNDGSGAEGVVSHGEEQAQEEDGTGEEGFAFQLGQFEALPGAENQEEGDGPEEEGEHGNSSGEGMEIDWETGTPDAGDAE
jgi:hypothetical protein